MNIITKLCQSVDNLAQKVTVLATVSLMATVHFTPIATLAQPESESPEAAAAEAAAASALDDLAESPDLIPFEEAIADREKKEGLFNLYYDEKERLVYAEIQPEQLERTYLLQSSLSRGIGEFGLYRGMPLDAISVTLRRVRNTLEVVVPNALIRSSPGDVTEGREDQFFSDSVVMSLPIVSIGDSGEQGGQSLLVDLDPLFSPGSPVFQGLANWVGFLGYGAGFGSLETVDAFPLNLEFEAVYQFTGGAADGFFAPVTVPNAAAFNLGVHYSFSEITPNPNFQPRPADERVGYFLTSYWDLSKRRERDPFVRYINRWHLEKQDPAAELSPPTKPIVFWIENTVPPEYREAVRNGVLMWNTAFEKLGFQDAIVVEQMPDDADWDPADVRYNTIRWTTSIDGGFAFGPSRVNPYTGEILDSDILVDENYVRFSVGQFRALAEDPLGGPAAWSRLTQDPRICDARMGMLVLKNPKLREKLPDWNRAMDGTDLCYSQHARQMLSLGALYLSLSQNVLPSSSQMKEFVEQAVQHVVAHEVGHALGLRHNFHGSTLRSPEELQNPVLSQDGILSSSVMDYLPPNLAAPGFAQGNFFPLGIGEYDEWVIAYGYTPLEPDLRPNEARRRLKTIADQVLELDYGTDEDAFTDLDPEIARFDLSNDALTYNLGQMDLAQELWHKLDTRYPAQGESYSEGRFAFNQIFFHYIFNAYELTRYVGGRSLTRYLGGDTTDRYPLEPVELEKQRQALQIINDRVFRAEAFDFPPTLARKLPAPRWFDWSNDPFTQEVEYPLADRVLTWQTLILADLFAPYRLERLRDATFQYPEADPLALPELFSTVQTAIWDNYLNFDRDQTEIPLLQRRLQQNYLSLLINLNQEGYTAVENATTFPEFLLAIYTINAPREAKNIARYYLEDLGKQVKKAMKEDGRLDLESQLHLSTSYDRIQAILDRS
ncbi:MAG: zinc-dependent metalloprotease, partial [Prochlorotrichaceae cyanobacterium]